MLTIGKITKRWTKSELTEEAEDLGINVKKNWKRIDIYNSILKKRGEYVEPDKKEVSFKDLSLIGMTEEFAKLGFNIKLASKYSAYTLYYSIYIKKLKFRPESVIQITERDIQWLWDQNKFKGEWSLKILRKFFGYFSLELKLVSKVDENTNPLPLIYLPDFPVVHTWTEATLLQRKYNFTIHSQKKFQWNFNNTFGITLINDQHTPYDMFDEISIEKRNMYNELPKSPIYKVFRIRFTIHNFASSPFYLHYNTSVVQMLNQIRKSKALYVNVNAGPPGYGRIETVILERIHLDALNEICKVNMNPSMKEYNFLKSGDYKSEDPQYKKLFTLINRLRMRNEKKDLIQYPLSNANKNYLLDIADYGEITDPDIRDNYKKLRKDILSEYPIENYINVSMDLIGIIQRYIVKLV